MNNPEWISHRGLDEHYTENSRHAFDAARDAGFRHLETDLRSTRDGHLLLHHDRDLYRTTGHRASLSDLSMDDARQVRYTDGQGILTFDDFAEHFHDNRWILDIKPEAGERTIKALNDWAEKNRCKEWLTRNARFLLWDPRQRQLLLRYFPSAHILADEKQCRRAGLSILMGLPGLARIRPEMTYALPPRFMGRDLFNNRILRHYHRKGARFLAYLPERREDIERAVESGADEVLINGRPLNR
ncbi:MAG: glycerophosphodiester phosphodiesterase family protein [Oleiphilaceae bacterium]|nr:glycerophosphodiester phosphodiesterase family protein [Oleiphilaceae bacterium]